ncbi:MAG: tRNA (adenosine(37)-N6)-dimethylallyltransferase MiaA [Xanthomonadales bacterium]|nr:tRNA (adenosine(37)-N6)-dimethylallyltransferase MiaA [Xanthomonadales bacterium]
MPPSVVICGPTAAGKTEIALEIARRLPVRLISADSVQVYRGMDIGTAKPDARTLAEFPHALIDIRDPEEGYSAAEFADDAGAEMASAWSGGALPVVVGGTALYLRALRYGLDAMPSADAALRQRIADEAEAVGWPAMHGRLAKLDPQSGRRIRVSDPQRIQRALEICLASGRPASSFHRGRGPDRLVDSLFLVVSPADRDQLHNRIEARWSRMLELGLVDEVERLLKRPGLSRRSMALRAVGYRQTLGYLDGALAREDLVDRASAATRQLAKRQLTAFRKWTGGMWYDPLNIRTIDRIIKRVSRFGAAKGIAP